MKRMMGRARKRKEKEIIRRWDGRSGGVCQRPRKEGSVGILGERKILIDGLFSGI